MTNTQSSDIVTANIGDAHDFIQFLVEHVAERESIWNGAHVVFIPADDPERAAENIRVGMVMMKRGLNVYFHHVGSWNAVPA